MSNIVGFEIGCVSYGFYIMMVSNEHDYAYRYCNTIKSYLQIDNDDFINNLKSYGGKLLQLFNDCVDDAVIFFLDKEKAKVFIKDYLELLLIAKKLS